MKRNLREASLKENSILWLFKILSGLLIVVLMTLHFIVNHLIYPQGLLNYADVITYYSNILIPIIEIIFLALVVTHSLTGLRGILLDLNPNERITRWINWVLSVFGIIAFSYGAWLAIVVALKSP
ncbi:MAG: hypothetical protein JEZ06_22235 [Anaerolineaceae bacterium]|nr:hypothetical protein [Anaerolineaceae bacterium]